MARRNQQVLSLCTTERALRRGSEAGARRLRGSVAAGRLGTGRGTPHEAVGSTTSTQTGQAALWHGDRLGWKWCCSTRRPARPGRRWGPCRWLSPKVHGLQAALGGLPGHGHRHGAAAEHRARAPLPFSPLYCLHAARELIQLKNNNTDQKEKKKKVCLLFSCRTAAVAMGKCPWPQRPVQPAGKSSSLPRQPPASLQDLLWLVLGFAALLPALLPRHLCVPCSFPQ